METPFETERAYSPLGFKMVSSQPGHVVWTYDVQPEHYNPFHVLHGGVVMALLDTAMGHAVATLSAPQGRINAAAQMNTHFLAPVRDGQLTAEARVLKMGKRLAVVQAEARLADGTVVALATAQHSLLP